MTMKNRTITVQGAEIAIATRHEQDYISLTDMVRNFDGGSALIEQWLKNKDTVLFLGIWEQLNNPSFNSLEFDGIKNEAGRNSFFLSAKKWIEATGAIGLDARAGRYGGILPENIPPAGYIKAVEKRLKSARPKLALDDRGVKGLLGEKEDSDE